MTTPWTETTSRNHRHHNPPSSSSYQDDDDPHAGENPAAEPGVLPQRKKLQLKPRSVRPADAATTTTATTSSSSSSAKSNPFGAAKPREVVLAAKGLDARLMDLRIEQKVQSSSAHHKHYTKDQERQLESVRSTLTQLEEDLREANENELPEQAILEQLDVTRKELQALTSKFDQENEEAAAATTGGAGHEGKPSHPKAQAAAASADQPHDANRPRFERPSQRRRRLDEQDPDAPHQHHQNSHHHPRNAGGGPPNAAAAVDGEAYSSFSTNRRRRGSEAV